MGRMHMGSTEQGDPICVALVPMGNDQSILVAIRPLASLCLDLRIDGEAKRFRNACLEAIGQLLASLLHSTPDENDPVLTGSILGPGRCERLVLQHMDALEHKLLVAASDVQQCLDSKEIPRLLLCAHEVVQEFLEEKHVQGTLAPDTNVGDRAVHLWCHPRAAEFLFGTFETMERSCFFQHLGEVEGANVEQLLNGNLRILTLDDFRC
mmetsp:Transcript_81305/g.136011  ORF Transcript_81305/g.136011 Transcript_81305/m.136011 type:complete len:209 (+) Transcript_81305:1176-1802(+)